MNNNSSGSSKSDAWGAIKSILVVQAFVSALIALGLIGGTVYVASGLEGNSAREEILEILKSWGGVIIGFYFGTAYTQIATLVRALEGTAAPESNKD